ncbi:MAG TPA: DUF4097 family beta strand repeat-containing protein [Caulobacteraceae bacterium]|nr:DUF4097 family beta strand repeat-containing protein [Caulobacteraceae bacterium]
MTADRRMETFETPAPIRLRVDIPKGRIKVLAEETAVTRIELTARHGDSTARAWIAEAEIARNGDDILVKVHRQRLMLFGMGGSIDAVIHAPLASAVKLSTGSGRVETIGRLGDVNAASGSGLIQLDHCAEARAHTGSGDIVIAGSAGSVDAKTGSGRISVGKVGANARIVTGSGHAELAEVAGEATLTTASGNIEIGQAGDGLEAFAASGSIQVRRADHGRVRAKTLSGRICVGVASGSAALLDISTMSGRVNSELREADAPADGEKRVELVLSTMSGNVDVARA